jgi:hypothetical protein
MRTTTSSVSAETSRGAIDVHALSPDPTSRKHRRGRTRALVMAVEALVVVGVAAAGWLIARERDSDDAEGPVSAVEPPQVVLDVAGWELTSFADSDMRPWGDPIAVFVDPTKGVTGPKLVATVLQTGTGNFLDAPEQSVEVGAVTGRLYVDGDNTVVHWVDPSGTTLELYGWKIDTDDVIDTAATIAVDADGQPTTTASLPNDVVRADSELEALLSRYVHYNWNGPGGQVVELILTARGGPTQRDNDESCCAEGLARITVNDEQATFESNSPDNYRVNQVRGFWELELNSSIDPANPTAVPAANPHEFLGLIEQLSEPGATIWRRSLPDGTVLRDEFPQVMGELVATLTAPPGFSNVTIPNDGNLPTRSAIAYTLAFNAACAWIDQLETAHRLVDEPSATTAVRAIGKIAAWTELDGIPEVEPLAPDRPTRLGLLRTAAAALEDSSTSPARARVAIRCA